jgi:hypothetical protein
MEYLSNGLLPEHIEVDLRREVCEGIPISHFLTYDGGFLGIKAHVP